MKVNSQKPIEFINECSCIVDLDELEKAILWYQSKPTLSKKKIYLQGSYHAISVYNQKLHVHRLLMQYWLNTKLPSEYIVHHLNGNKLDARKENLSLILNSVHNSRHNKGRIFSDSHREKIALANKKRKGMKMKKRVNVPNDKLREFISNGKSINWIASYFDCDWSTIKSRINENPELLGE